MEGVGDHVATEVFFGDDFVGLVAMKLVDDGSGPVGWGGGEGGIFEDVEVVGVGFAGDDDAGLV